MWGYGGAELESLDFDKGIWPKERIGIVIWVSWPSTMNGPIMIIDYES